MISTVPDAEGLRDLLEALNRRGVIPTVAVLTADGNAVLAYGIDEGDTMGYAYFADPGEDRWRGESKPGEGNYINDFEGSLDDLKGPFRVMYHDAEPWESGSLSFGDDPAQWPPHIHDEGTGRWAGCRRCSLEAKAERP